MTEDEAPIRGEIRVRGYRRVSHGLYLPLAQLAPHEEWLRDLGAWRMVLPEDAVFTHVTAAALAGWWLPQLPEYVPVFAATTLHANRPRRPGLVCSRLDRDASELTFSGMPVDHPVEVLLRCSRDLTLLDLVPLVTAALRLGHVTPAELATVCATTRPGVRRLRWAVSLADARSESWWECALRLFHVTIDVPVEPQVQVYDDRGNLAARVDLLVTGTSHVHEYDGGQHREVRRHQLDLRRERRLADTSYTRRGFTADDLVNHPLVVLSEIDRALGRRHRPSRADLWRRWVAESTLSTGGRRRLMNRWLRLSGLTDWSRTA
jgi:hypothetical protein